jgi:hypothetical protein
MNKITRFFVIIVLAACLALLLTAFTQFLASRASFTEGDFSASLNLQATATPVDEDQSEIGSTDGIVVLGGVITLIIIIPILARRKYWLHVPSQ